MASSILIFLILLAFSFFTFKESDWKITDGLKVMLAITFIGTLYVISARPFIFDGKDANNLILGGIYLMIAGAIFSIPIAVFIEDVLKGIIPPKLKKVIIFYISYSLITLIYIILEAMSYKS